MPRIEDILCQGRGSAANSAVCYCLGITAVDPTEVDLLFERFVSMERNEPPDIDVDFEHERREEVIQYVYRALWPRARRHRRDRDHLSIKKRHSRGRQGDGAFKEDVTSALAGTVWGVSEDGHARGAGQEEAGLDPNEPRSAARLSSPRS